MQLKFLLTALAALVPLAVATTVSTNCKSTEFKWEAKSCCLPKGGPPAIPTPPKGTNCPPSTHYWETKQGCCAPRNPPPSNPTPPQCPKGWTWKQSLYRCEPTPTPPTTEPSKPSSKPGHHYKRTAKKSRTSLCPTGLDACPVSSLVGLSGDYECLDTSSELESCGGCSSLGEGQDCTAIKGAWNVGCEQGSCIVYTCSGGFQLGADNKSCVPL